MTLVNDWSRLETIQPNVVKMLQNSILKDRIAHAYLFQGSRGTGKKEVSVFFAQSVLCKFRDGAMPCQKCKDCTRIVSGNHPDVHFIQPEGQSIKKEQILHLQKEFTYTGMESNKKVYIIKHADKMTTNASNRLLKFLEEPSKDTVAMLLTENSNAILDTIRSRCQVMAFQPLNAEELQANLKKEGVTESKAKLIASLTNNLEEALEISQDEWFANARNLVIQLVEVLVEKSDESLLFLHNQWMPHFQDRDGLQKGLDLLILFYKDLIYEHIGKQASIVYVKEVERIQSYVLYITKQRATDALSYILEAKRKLMSNVHPMLVMEQLVLQLQR